jgi:hypothetical protein
VWSIHWAQEDVKRPFSDPRLYSRYAVCAEREERYTRSSVAPQLLDDFGDIDVGEVVCSNAQLGCEP